ncbi:MAG: type II secretion system protein GspJ [Sandaracinobacteroides sp.]
MTARSDPGRAAALREAGFTLVELLVSLLLFGIIAGIATTLTVGATRSFAASDTALAAVQQLETTRAILAADLGQAARRPSLAADGTPMPAFLLTPTGFVLVRYRTGGVLPEIEKVAWGLEDGRLLRQSFPAVDGAEPGQAVVMASGIRAVRLRVADAGAWQDGWTPRAAEDLPAALELTLLRADGVPVTLKLLVAS